MKEIISKYFPILLLGIGLLMLPFTPSRAPSEPLPTQAATDPTDPTAPAATEPADALARVTKILDATPLTGTAVSHCICDDTLHSADGLTGAGAASPAHALARLCGQRRMNPISALWLLKEERVYHQAPELSVNLAAPAFSAPEWEPRDYPYTAAGARDFLAELLTLSASLEDGLPMEALLLGEDGTLEQNQIYLAQEDCYYTYFVCYDAEAAHFLCFYLRGGETITDAEFQLLNLRYAQGGREALNELDQMGDRQAAALMTAAELLLTGQSRAADGRTPFDYSLADFTVTLERIPLSGSGDSGVLTNYRIQK